MFNGTRNIQWHTEYRMAHGLWNGIRNVEHPSAATYICRHTYLSAHTSVDTHLCRHTPLSAHTSIGTHLYRHTSLSAHISVGTHLCRHTPLLAVISAGSHLCQPDPPRTWLHLHSNPAPNYRVIADTRAHRHDSCQYGCCYWVLAETQGLAPPVCC